MGIRHFITLLGITLVIATTPTVAAMDKATITVAAPASDELVGQYRQDDTSQAVWARRGALWAGIPLWLTAVSLATGVFIAFIWIYLYQKQRHWQRVELARREVKAFRERDAIRKVLDILDYEEYRLFYVNHPQDGRLLTFEADDFRLRRALRSHDQMVKTRQGLDEIKRLAQRNSINAKTMAVFEQYENEEFVIEIILRDWFDSFLSGLEYFDSLIESGMISAKDLRPFVIHWVRLIGDRNYRRKGGSGFYDQLFHYIHWAGYSRVQKLFERYGYKILPPPYSTHDLNQIAEDKKYDTHRALALAKAAYLVYEDREYVNDIVRKWVSEDIDNLWMRMSPREYVVDLMKNWVKEGQADKAHDIRESFRYLDMLITDTQAFIFRQGKDIILVFRGSQQLNDWRTNFKIRLKQFTLMADQKSVPPKGMVHRGFLDAWQSVEKMVVYYLKKWRTPETRLWVTGHSLGGALAAMATISLESQGFEVSGLYTFGQPRIADWTLVNYMNGKMRDRIYRYANNNDVVPLIPPPFLPWAPLRVYGHMGHFRYFDFRGNLQRHSFPLQRIPDRLLGYLTAIGRSGLDSVNDHKMEFYLANLQRAVNKEI
ncbi:MAG TPA: lipase family protein, partial [Leptolyngbyaceae cyanobacterium]